MTKLASIVSIDRMAMTRDELIGKIESYRASKNWSLRELAKQCKVPYQRLLDLRHARAYMLKADHLENVLSEIGIIQHKIPISGVISSGGVVKLNPKNEITHIQLPPSIEYSSDLQAWEFLDNSNEPMAYKGWVYITGKEILIPLEFTDAPYWIKLSDGQILIRRIKRGSEPGKYHLLSPTGQLMENVEIASCAKIKHIIPK